MKNDEYQPLRLTDKELLEVFPEATHQTIPKKIREWEKRYSEVKEEIKAVFKEAPQKDLWFYEILLTKFRFPELYECEKHIFRLKRLLAISRSNGAPIFDFQTKLEIAKRRPIYELARDKLELRQVGKKYVARCPFHDERTPSFYLYPESNTFHCFGCGKHGDVINLTQQLSGLTFKEAVESLQ